MKIVGLITEYNPFHNGHLYHIRKAKEITGADSVVVVMSGDFVQRGAPALIDKYTRAKMALSCGADLVLELPVVWATASAEYFAAAGTALLDRLGIVDSLCFGCETPDTDAFLSLARFLSQESFAYRSALHASLKEGKSYPKARQEAVLRTMPQSSDSVVSILSSPNNILGLEYCRALHRQKSAITPVPIQRIGCGYLDTDLDSAFVSASGIRSYLHCRPDSGRTSTELLRWMPESACRILADSSYPLLFEEDFSALLGHSLLLTDSFTGYADSTEDLSNRICRMRTEYRSLPDFLEKLKTKEVTYTRLARLLLHILLEIRESDYTLGKSLNYTPYARVLGFRESASPLLSALKTSSAVPLVTSPRDQKAPLNEDARALLEKDLFAGRLYRLAAIQKSGCLLPEECQRPFLRLPS